MLTQRCATSRPALGGFIVSRGRLLVHEMPFMVHCILLVIFPFVAMNAFLRELDLPPASPY